MNDQVTRLFSGTDLADSIEGDAGGSSLLVESAIIHCEKLRRVVELEEWISGARDNPILAATCRRWEEERAQLLAELHLERARAI
jgi:hypothetical protein